MHEFILKILLSSLEVVAQKTTEGPKLLAVCDTEVCLTSVLQSIEYQLDKLKHPY